jgi:hypothetical protein
MTSSTSAVSLFAVLSKPAGVFTCLEMAPEIAWPHPCRPWPQIGENRPVWHPISARMKLSISSALAIGLIIGACFGIALENIIAGISIGIVTVIALRWERGSGGE